MDPKSKNLFAKNKLALLSSTALLAFCIPGAHAQEEAGVEPVADESAEDEALVVEEVVVTGIRGALQTSRDLKRDADTFVDSITASDVTQLPDLSVAEALSRVPGVVTQRFELGGSDGDFPTPEGSGNIIRGLQYARSEFNGRDSFSATGGRALEWASIPPELIGAVEVYKSQSADLIEGGIAGTVNLRTLEPFDKSGRVGIIVLDGTYTDLAEEFSPGGSIVLGDRWDTDMGEFGLLGSFSTSNLKSGIHGFQYGQVLALRYPDANSDNTVAVPGGWQARDVLFDRQRDSYYLAGQWRSLDGNHEITAKAVRVENSIQSDERTFEFFTDAESWANWEFLGNASIVPFTSEGLPRCNGAGARNNGGPNICEQLIPVNGGLFESGIVSNGLRDWLGQGDSLGTPIQGLAVSQLEESVTQDFSINYKWRATDNLYFEFDAHYTEAEATLDRLWAGTNVFADYEFDFSDTENPEVRLFLTDARIKDGTDPYPNEDFYRGDNNSRVPESLDDPAASFLLYAADQFEDNEGDLFAWRADTTYEFENDPWFESIKFGARRSEREQSNRSAGLNWAAIAAPWSGGYLPYSDVSGENTYEVWDFSNHGRGGVFVGENTGFIFPSRALMNDYDAFVDFVDNEPLLSPEWRPLRRDGVTDFIRGADSLITEDTTNFYARMDINREFDNGQSLEGNFGVRYSNTDYFGRGQFSYNPIPDKDEPPIANSIPELIAYMDEPTRTESFDRADEYYLPSLNLKWNLNDEMLLRFGSSRSIMRPNMSDLNPGGNAYAPLRYITDPSTNQLLSVESTGNIIIAAGNPDLKPISAVNLDLSYEYYFGEDGQFSVSYFNKSLEDVIVYTSEIRGTVELDGETLGLEYRMNLNLIDGKVEGVEVAYQQFFTEAPGLLANTGIQANFTFIESESSALPSLPAVNAPGAGDDFLFNYRWDVRDLLGLSDFSYNLVGIYQTDNLEARIAYTWRSKYVSSYRDYITGNPISQDDIGYLDASIKYNITDALQIRLLGANLLDTKSVAHQQIDQSGQTFGRSVFWNDRRFELGITYSF